jgi:hypothetical protein
MIELYNYSLFKKLYITIIITGRINGDDINNKPPPILDPPVLRVKESKRNQPDNKKYGMSAMIPEIRTAFILSGSLFINFFFAQIATITNGAATKILCKISGNSSSRRESGLERVELIMKKGIHVTPIG